MKTRNYLLIAATATFLAAPGFALAAQADSASKTRAEVINELAVAHQDGAHQMNSEVMLPAVQSGLGKTRAKVVSELNVAHQNGTHQMASEVMLPAVQSGPGKTRAEVVSGLANMTALEKNRLHEIYLGGS